MIKHVVMWKFKEFADGRSKSENMKLAKDRLEDLTMQIPEIKMLKVYLNSEIAPEANFDVVLDSEFESFEALGVYAKHPKHVEVAGFIKQVVEARTAVDGEV
jgi:hypothetical protein